MSGGGKSDRELLEEIHDSVTILQVDFRNACDDLKEVRGDVYGNGKDGIKRELHEHLVRHDERGKVWKVLATLGSGTGISSLIAWLVTGRPG